MSGLEIAGIVLGAIPIIIGALERYRERQSRIAFRNKEPFILRLIQSLNAQHFLIMSDIQITLADAGVEYDRSSVQVGQQVFENPDVADAVNAYLGSDSAVNFDAIERCHMVLAELVASIKGLGSVPQELADLVKTYPSKGGRYELPKKIKFPIKRDALDRRIQELDQATTTLRRIRDNMTAMKAQTILPSGSREISQVTSALNMVRHQANNLYSAISVAYSAECHPAHEARLFLRSQFHLVERLKSNREPEKSLFTVLFSPAMTRNTQSYKTDITVTRDEEDCFQRGRHSIRRRKVAIHLPYPGKPPNPPQIVKGDLCKCIGQAKDGSLFLDLHLFPEKRLGYYGRQRPGSHVAVHTQESADGFVSLEQLLEDRSSSPWLRTHRMALSLIITSSLLQLVQTPWLRVPMTSRSVRFSRGSIKIASLDFSAVPEPFVEGRFIPERAPDRKQCSVREYMLELGIMLLEVEHWRKFDDFKEDLRNGGQAIPDDRYALAQLWVDKSMYEILPFHYDAVTRCIECTFASSGPTFSWDDVVLRKSIAEYVLKPLQENCPQQLR
ncbi:hypothetical protein BJX61DRAFT_531544 [Aspergillus egyptiacus]|nr:hypothetical protein BJX61DRAFT_531544 [Aspergillus egyptiacus]